MSLFNADAGKAYYREKFFAPQAHIKRKESTSAQVPVQSGRSVDVQKKADDELAKFLADVHNNIGLWRPLPKQTSVGKWLDLFNQSWGAPAMQAWMKAQNLIPRSLRLQGSTLTAQSIMDGKITQRTFTPSDGSGWWPIGRQAIASAAVLDPQQSGLVGGARAVLWPENVMAFYGLTWPLSHAQADQLRASGFPAVSVAHDYLRSPEVLELASREFMDAEQEAALIKTLLSAIKDKPDHARIDLRTTLQALTPGSSFAIANKSKPQLLKNLRDHPLMLPVLRGCQADWNAPVRLVDGEFFIKSRGRFAQWINVTVDVRGKPELASLLDNAIKQAKSTGNIINSGAKASAEQLLRFAGIDALPARVSVTELQNLLNWKLNPVPPGPSLGSYARDFLTFAQSPDYLSTEQRVRVRRSASATDAAPTLVMLDCSPQPWSGNTLEHIRANADELITQSLTQGAGLGRCDPILRALKDDPSSPMEEASPSYRKQMILTRDLLCIDPELGLKRNHIAGYDLYSASNTGKTLSEVRAELEQYIGATKQIPMNQAVLVTHALLATVAPEFLVKGAGEERVGCSALVNLRIQTAMVELAAQGSSREMSTEQISSRALLSPVSNDHQQLQAVESAGPIYDWALAQGVVRPQDDYSPSAVKRALKSFNQRIDEHTAMSRNLDKARAVYMTRLEAGRQELERVCPGNSDFFKKATIYAEPDSVLYKIGKAFLSFSGSISGAHAAVIDGLPVSTAEHLIEASSLYDLYICGVLTAENVSTKAWKFTSPQARMKFEALTPQLSKLKPIYQVFDGTFNAGTEHLEKFKLMSARVMMSEMPLEDRVRLEFGQVFVLGASATQRPENGGLSQAQAQQEMGPIVYASDASGAQCYEFLPSTNSYRLRPELLAGMNTLKKVDIEKHKNTFSLLKKQYPTLAGDIDIKGYFPADKHYQNGSAQVPNTYSSTRTNELIKVFKNNRLLINRPLMLTRAKGTTKNESVQQRFDAAESFIINTLIPFKSNIEDIASGDPKRAAMGMLGLGLEIFGALFVVGSAVKAAAKGTTIAFKLGQLGKAAVSMFNLPGAVMDTSKSLYRLSSVGVRSLGNAGSGTLAKGLADIRKWVSGVHSQSQARRSFKAWTAKDTADLLSNTGLINTGIGARGFSQEPLPEQSPGSTINALT
ncbi:hypothetical protein [Pseudomonas sp. 1152_12]|uniref:hypothetical protein n=1 Tax=Pseudomonas sp. 1152_12 TaxID=2604455 RepID=UPI004064544F